MSLPDLFTIGSITNNLTNSSHDLCFSCSFNSILTVDHNPSAERTDQDDLIDLLTIQIADSFPENKICYIDIHLSGFNQQQTLNYIDTKPKKGLVVTEENELERNLKAIISEGESRIRSLLGTCSSIYEQNENSDRKTPIIILIIDNFPLGWSNSAISLLNKILRASHITGVVTLIKGIQENLDELEINRKKCIQIKGGNEVSNPVTPNFLKEWFQLNLNFVDIPQCKSVFKKVSGINSSNADFSISDGINVLIGYRYNKPYHFKLQCDEPHLVHAIIAGGTGSGKTVLLNKIISECIKTYTPDELSLYLVDLKEGVEFNIYKQSPNVCQILDNTAIKEAIQLLENCILEIESRGKLFSNLAVRNIQSYNNKSETKLPRILVIIDEFQKLYGSEFRKNNHLNSLLSDLARRARSFGINIILSSQAISDSKVERQTLDQFALKIALRMSERESRFFLNTDNSDAADLDVGEAIYNTHNGQKQHNHKVKVDYLSEEALFDIIKHSSNNNPAIDILAKHKNTSPVVPEKKPITNGNRQDLSSFKDLFKQEND